jgi:hypothetical protein
VTACPHRLSPLCDTRGAGKEGDCGAVPAAVAEAGRAHQLPLHPEAGAAAVASVLAAVLTEIYLCNVCSCQEILRRNGRGQLLDDMQVKANVAALSMEEITPAAVSNATLLAPEEVFDKQKAELVSQAPQRSKWRWAGGDEQTDVGGGGAPQVATSEQSQAERRRKRAKGKSSYKKKEAARAAERLAIQRLKPELKAKFAQKDAEALLVRQIRSRSCHPPPWRAGDSWPPPSAQP